MTEVIGRAPPLVRDDADPWVDGPASGQEQGRAPTTAAYRPTSPSRLINRPAEDAVGARVDWLQEIGVGAGLAEEAIVGAVVVGDPRLPHWEFTPALLVTDQGRTVFRALDVAASPSWPDLRFALAEAGVHGQTWATWLAACLRHYCDLVFDGLDLHALVELLRREAAEEIRRDRFQSVRGALEYLAASASLERLDRLAVDLDEAARRVDELRVVA